MSQSELVLLGVVIGIAVVVAILLFLKRQRSQRLQSRFGPEYGRTVQETGNKMRAEARLEKLEKRVQRFNIVPLTPDARADFVAAWQRVQSRFVDDPRTALLEADALIQKIMGARGYPVADFEQRAADVSVDHPFIVEHYRAGHDIWARHSQGQATTEDMRQAMIHYRALFAELADEPELTHATTVRGMRA